MTARRWRLPPPAILALGWAIQILYAYPGQLTQDSFDHIREARTGVYSDAHPPMIDLIMKVCDTVVAGPLGFLLLQTGLFVAGLYALWKHVLSPRGAAWATTAIVVFPPSLVVMGVIWKDCMMAGWLVVGIAGLLAPARWKRVGGLVALAIATACRYNAFGATFPLVVWLFAWRDGQRWWARYPIAIAAWLGLTVAAFAANGALTDKEMHYWASSLGVYDIVGTYATVDEDLPDAVLREDLAGTQILVDKDLQATMRAVYTPRDFLPILNDPKRTLWNLPINGYEPAPEAQREAIARAWKHVVTTYPGAFLRHRLAVFAAAIDLDSTRSLGAVTRRGFRYPDYASAQGLYHDASTLQKESTRALLWLTRHTGLFTPWAYAAAALILLGFARRDRLAAALLLSGLGMELTLLPLVHARDYRYSHWMIVTTIAAALVLTIRRARTSAALRR